MEIKASGNCNFCGSDSLIQFSDWSATTMKWVKCIACEAVFNSPKSEQEHYCTIENGVIVNKESYDS